MQFIFLSLELAVQLFSSPNEASAESTSSAASKSERFRLPYSSDLFYAGMHVPIALLLVSYVGVWLLRGDQRLASNLIASTASETVASYIFGVVPLFVLMGLLVSAADLGRDAFVAAGKVLRAAGRTRHCNSSGQCGVCGHHRHFHCFGGSFHKGRSPRNATLRLCVRFCCRDRCRQLGPWHAHSAKPAHDRFCRIVLEQSVGRSIYRRYRTGRSSRRLLRRHRRFARVLFPALHLP